MNQQRPSQKAEALIALAEDDFEKGQISKASIAVKSALELRPSIERFPHQEEVEAFRDHRCFTDVMRRAFVLLLKLGDVTEAKFVYQRARTWADDPNCSSKMLFAAIEADWRIRYIHFLDGWTKRFVIYPVLFFTAE